MPVITEIEEEENHSLNNFSSHQEETGKEEEEGEEVDDDDDEEDEEEDEEEPVTLGFVEKPKNPRLLLRHYFPSKAGGVPAWLDPIDLPSEKSRICGICGDPLQFLLQVYAPLFDRESTFHRTLFVFMCPSMTCLLKDQHEQWKRRPEKQSRSVKVFRCQLSRSNPFYSWDPPSRDRTEKPSKPGALLCDWCGTWKGDKVCGSCKCVRYCSEKHQVMHWRSGHKMECQRISMSMQSSDSTSSISGTTSTDISKVASKTLWPEFEIINVDESVYDMEASEHNFSSSLVSKEKVDGSIKSLMDSFEGDGEKKSWASFQERITKAPEQVLRCPQDLKAKPQWPMSSGRPSKTDIPKCIYCDGPLSYEIQILPQLLYYFGVKNDADSLDWATIVVYTCADSCETSIAYKEEFAWVQLPSSPFGLP